MQFQVSSRLEYAVEFPSTLILSIHAQNNAPQTIVSETFSIEPPVNVEEFRVANGDTRFVRLETGPNRKLIVDYRATVECAGEVIPKQEIEQTPVVDMHQDAIPYLFPSRYCQSDKLSRLAWDLFGKIEHPYEKVTAIVEWIHDNVEYLSGSTNSQTSAYDTVTQRTGVCRDFAHLGITLCRALNIPSRYFSGYAYQLDPPDFHACFESYIGGRWLIFDATRLAHLNGLVRIGTGRDAADASVASIFGRAKCVAMEVDCQLSPGQQFSPIGRKELNRQGVSLEAGDVPTEH